MKNAAESAAWHAKHYGEAKVTDNAWFSGFSYDLAERFARRSVEEEGGKDATVIDRKEDTRPGTFLVRVQWVKGNRPAPVSGGWFNASVDY